MAKRLIALISTTGKTLKQLKEEVLKAIGKYKKVEKIALKSKKDFVANEQKPNSQNEKDKGEFWRDLKEVHGGRGTVIAFNMRSPKSQKGKYKKKEEI